MPTIFKNISQGDIVAMAMEDEELTAWDEALVNAALYEELDKQLSQGVLINPEEVAMEQQRLLEKLRASGNERYVQLLDNIDFMEYDVAVDITNESVDKGVIATNLIQALTAAPEYREVILPQLFDMMGLTFTKPITPPQPQGMNGQPAGTGQQPSPQAPAEQNPVLALGRANTLATKGLQGG
jgi:hypothetical protein